MFAKRLVSWPSVLKRGFKEIVHIFMILVMYTPDQSVLRARNHFRKKWYFFNRRREIKKGVIFQGWVRKFLKKCNILHAFISFWILIWSKPGPKHSARRAVVKVAITCELTNVLSYSHFHKKCISSFIRQTHFGAVTLIFSTCSSTKPIEKFTVIFVRTRLINCF